jgi:hypothetical protein
MASSLPPPLRVPRKVGQAVGRVGEHQGVGGGVAVFHQEGLGQQRDEAALAVGDDVDGVLGS